MTYVKKLKNIRKTDVMDAGGKGTPLGEMLHASFPVPDGFVVLANAFSEFISINKLEIKIRRIINSINPKELKTIKNASEKIQKIILNTEIPEKISEPILKAYKVLGAKSVAIRSSATNEDSQKAAWAGQLSTYLNSNKTNLLTNIKRCWASPFSLSAISYGLEQDFNNKDISVAVVVQKMVNPEKSGIAFSVHPITQDLNKTMIEAVFGLGEVLASGKTTPDNFVIDKNKQEVSEIHINNKTKKQVLNQNEILNLNKIIIKIEKYFGFPVDIEWAIEKKKFYILQCRPITTLGNTSLVTFEKSITRDWSVIYTQIWHEAYTKEFWKQFGWGYKEVLYERVNERTIGYRSPSEHITGLCDFVTNKLNKESTWLEKESKKLTKEVNDVLAYIKKHQTTCLSNHSNKELANIFENFIKLNLALGPRFIITLWFPTHMEHKKEFKKYKTAINSAIKARKVSEKIGPIAEDFIKTIGVELSSRIQLPEQLIKYLTYEEVSNFFRNDIRPSIDLLKKRSKYYLITSDGVLVNETLENYLAKHGYKLKKPATGKTLEIHGSIAFPGIAVGLVKVINNKKTLSQFKNGEVLVTSMTTPDYYPLIKKSVAFVTDEGGITCHAAIAARELKKPCIIGTKEASEILKNGDLVEIDANEGVIKIIKKK